jgi:hypothetical protein
MFNVVGSMSTHLILRPLAKIGQLDAVQVIGVASTSSPYSKPGHFDFCENSLKSVVNNQSLAGVHTHLAGRVADVCRTIEIARGVGAFVIEDAAQSMGGQLNGRAVGTFGDVGFFKPKSCNYIYRRYSSAYFRPDRISWGWMPAHPALFLRRRVVSRVGFFKTDYKIAGDFEYIVRIFYSRHVDYRYDPIIFVHMQAGGSSTRNWRSKLLLNHEVLRACYENGVNTNLLKIISKYPVKILGFFRK